ncbi:MAG TPA: alpha/beta hydrolase-fold protein [Bryobacteraceae bacterium]|nr:alpha/beta hydrolase-fold protein [Bryobacteraceae bacterium]
MNREYHKWFSPALGRDMELLVFGGGGSPLIVFPTSMGRFYDYENRNMIDAVRGKYENGELQAFCVDSVDAESWYNQGVSPARRAARHVEYDRYLAEELVPFVRFRNESPIGVTGCSFGGYHSVNFALRHPDMVASCVSMGGAFDIHQFLDGYYDDNCYYNCPPDFLPNLTDPWFLDRYRRMRIVLATGENDVCLGENRRLSGILAAKSIPHYLDIWGGGAGHDWPWWEQMARKFF